MKLHLGCGPRRISTYCNVDVISYAHIDLVSRIDCLPLPDECASVIYSSHTLEHFPRAQTAQVLREWYRLLRPNGTLRISVPDFDALVKVYISLVDTPIHERDRFGNLLDRAMSCVIGPIMGGQTGIYDFHQSLFNFTTLSAALESVGFRDVRRYDWSKTEHADVDDYSQAYLPHMDRGGVLVSLNVEATKRAEGR